MLYMCSTFPNPECSPVRESDQHSVQTAMRFWCLLDKNPCLVVGSQGDWGIAFQGIEPKEGSIAIQIVASYDDVAYVNGTLFLAFKYDHMPKALDSIPQLVYMKDPRITAPVERTGVPANFTLKGTIEHEVVTKLAVDSLLRSCLSKFAHIDAEVQFLGKDPRGTAFAMHQYLFLRPAPKAFPVMAVALGTSRMEYLQIKFAGSVLIPEPWTTSPDPVLILTKFRIFYSAAELKDFVLAQSGGVGIKVSPEVRELVVSAIRSFNLGNGDEDEDLSFEGILMSSSPLSSPRSDDGIPFEGVLIPKE